MNDFERAKQKRLEEMKDWPLFQAYPLVRSGSFVRHRAQKIKPKGKQDR